jgi:hypothetical protein
VVISPSFMSRASSPPSAGSLAAIRPAAPDWWKCTLVATPARFLSTTSVPSPWIAFQ